MGTRHSGRIKVYTWDPRGRNSPSLTLLLGGRRINGSCLPQGLVSENHDYDVVRVRLTLSTGGVVREEFAYTCVRQRQVGTGREEETPLGKRETGQHRAVPGESKEVGGGTRRVVTSETVRNDQPTTVN